PVALNAFGLLIGVVQAYVFAMLALVYIVSAVRSHRPGTQDGGGPPASAGTAEVARDLEPLLPPT
ncbi:MAG TPA: hypothetical protein VKA44_05860, partial [Gemmatimonadota bacterium]|nr:hypothetical protein [Gemmatimonadota bacterium]